VIFHIELILIFNFYNWNLTFVAICINKLCFRYWPIFYSKKSFQNFIILHSSIFIINSNIHEFFIFTGYIRDFLSCTKEQSDLQEDMSSVENKKCYFLDWKLLISFWFSHTWIIFNHEAQNPMSLECDFQWSNKNYLHHFITKWW
jgi:hypothetical protein